MSTGKPEIQYMLLQDADVQLVNDFYNRIYNENRTDSQFKWEFYNAPAGRAIYTIAKDAAKGNIVGIQCAIPIELVTETGEKILTAKSEDTLVDPTYRGLSIFENMYALLFTECEKAGIKYIWGFTSAKKPFLRLGFDVPYDHSQSLMVFSIVGSYKYLASLNPKNTFISLLKIAGLVTLAKFKSFKRMFTLSSAPKGLGLNVEDKDSVKSNNELLTGMLAGGYYTISQDSGFITWRFANNPHHTLVKHINILGSDAEIIATISFNLHKNGVWYLIHDMYATGLTEAEKAGLLASAVMILKHDEDVKLIRTWDFSHNPLNAQEITRREKVGFVHLERGIGFVWKSLDAENKLSADKFFLSRIASQGVI